jgi:hypothetical protein
MAGPLYPKPLNLTYQTDVPAGFPTRQSPLSPPDGSRYSNSGMQMTGGYLAIELVQDGQPLPRATLACYGTTLASGATDATGRATIGPLEPASDYTLVIQAPGSATQRFTGITIRQDETGHARIGMARGQTLRGMVSAQGRPVADAVVSDGFNSTMSGPDGRYELQGLSSEGITASVSKVGYRTARQSWSSLAVGVGEQSWELSATPVATFIDTSLASSDAPGAFSRLTEALRALGHRLVAAPPGDGGIWVMAVPARPLSPAEVARVEAFVFQGGKVVLLGEWGGYAGFDNVGANALAHRLGVHFNPDLVREDKTGSDALVIQGFERSVLTSNAVSAVSMYRACSLFSLMPGTGLAWTGEGAYHVQTAESGRRAVAFGEAFGAGKVVALADASAWSDEDADSNGVPNVLERDNLKFFSQLLAW